MRHLRQHPVNTILHGQPTAVGFQMDIRCAGFQRVVQGGAHQPYNRASVFSNARKRQRFGAGVERNPQIPGDAPNSWRIRQGDTWIHGCTRQEVLRHVLFKTLEDLNDTDGANTTAQVFPLCAYALLAQAIGKPVPQHLQDHEKAIVSRIAENRDELAARRIGQAEASRQSAIATEQSKQFFQEEYRRNRVAGPIQLAFCSSGLDPQKITAGSIEANFAINSTDSSQLGNMRGIQSVVSETHVRQAISARDKNLAYTDNQCWLRSSWLSLLQSASPEVLAARLQEMGSDTFAMSPSISPKQLAHIASQFRANPTHFLHREGMPADLADAVDIRRNSAPPSRWSKKRRV